MSNFENSGPAFPCETVCADEHGEYRLPWQGMTLRQYAAIKLRVPNSGTDWLDEMIRESLRDDLAAKAMQGICAHHDTWGLPDAGIATKTYVIADAMLAARGEEK